MLKKPVLLKGTLQPYRTCQPVRHPWLLCNLAFSPKASSRAETRVFARRSRRTPKVYTHHGCSNLSITTAWNPTLHPGDTLSC